MRIRLGLLGGLLVGIWLGAGSASSEPSRGADAAPFVEAVARWLDGPEHVALPLIAAEARAGNPAAQLLLALIDRTPSLQGPWLARLPRSERLALLRGSATAGAARPCCCAA